MPIERDGRLATEDAPAGGICYTEWQEDRDRQAIAGPTYKDEHGCLEIQDRPRQYPDWWGFRNRCSYPIMIGSCLEKGGSVRTKPPHPNELCDRTNPKPQPPAWWADTEAWRLMSMFSMIPDGPDDPPKMMALSTDTVRYWAFTCRP